MKNRILLLLVVGACWITPTAHAEYIMVGDLHGTYADPPNTSMAGAYFDLHIRPESLDVWIHQISWTGLTSPLLEARILCCEGAAVPAILVEGISNTTSGTFTATVDLTLESSFGPDFLAAHGGTADSARDYFFSRFQNMYGVVITASYPNGEIAGPLGTFIPEPATGVFVAWGIAALGSMRRCG